MNASCVAVVKLLWGTMVSLVTVRVPVVVATVVVVATRGVYSAVRRRRRACVFTANAVRTTVRHHAAFLTAASFAIVAQLA